MSSSGVGGGGGAPRVIWGGRLTPDQVLFDDVDVDHLSVSGFGATRPPMSDDSDSDAMREEFPFNLRDLERETNMVVIDMDRRDDWDDDRPYSPCTAGVRHTLFRSQFRLCANLSVDFRLQRLGGGAYLFIDRHQPRWSI